MLASGKGFATMRSTSTVWNGEGMVIAEIECQPLGHKQIIDSGNNKVMIFDSYYCGTVFGIS